MNKYSFKNKKILVVDDEQDIREIIATELTFFEAEVFEASDVQDAKKIVCHDDIDLVISDIRMPGETGMGLLKKVKHLDPNLPVILISGFADIKKEEALDEGVEILLQKPFCIDDLLFHVNRLLQNYQERISQHSNFPNIKNKLVITKDGDLKVIDYFFGRGGISLKLAYEKMPVLTKESEVELDLNLPEHQIRGEGICRWIKLVRDTKDLILGIEFTYLDKDSLKFFESWVDKNLPRSFIRSFNQ